MPLSRRETSLMKCKKIICWGEKKYDEAKEPAWDLHAHGTATLRAGMHEQQAENTNLAHACKCVHTPCSHTSNAKVSSWKPHTNKR